MKSEFYVLSGVIAIFDKEKSGLPTVIRKYSVIQTGDAGGIWRLQAHLTLMSKAIVKLLRAEY